MTDPTTPSAERLAELEPGMLDRLRSGYEDHASCPTPCGWQTDVIESLPTLLDAPTRLLAAESALAESRAKLGAAINFSTESMSPEQFEKFMAAIKEKTK